MRSVRPFTLLLAFLALLATSAPSPPAAVAQEPEAPAATAAAATPLLEDYLGEVDRVRQQILVLAEAMPEETYAWRPAEGVRSVAEVYLHVAFSNYALLGLAGYAPPAEVADRIAIDKIQAWDTSTTDKAEIAERVSHAFDHLRSTVEGLSAEDLEAQVDFFGQTPTRRQILLLILGHLHEHLGQSIAYARSNGVAPPWTAAQQEALREAAEGGEGGEGGGGE